MDWFERLTGFREESYAETRSKLSVEGDRLNLFPQREELWNLTPRSLAGLQELRDRVASGAGPAGRLRVEIVQGDVRELHRSCSCRGGQKNQAEFFER